MKCGHPKESWLNENDSGRHGWYRTTCSACGQFLGYVPKECEAYYKRGRQLKKQKLKDSEASDGK